MTAASASPGWEQVLAECEAAAAAAEALLNAKGELDAETIAAQSALDLWKLNMPPLPDELQDRARAVHRRQLDLQAKLVASMSMIEHQVRFATDGAQSSRKPQFLDRSV